VFVTVSHYPSILLDLTDNDKPSSLCAIELITALNNIIVLPLKIFTKFDTTVASDTLRKEQMYADKFLIVKVRYSQNFMDFFVSFQK
jgi:hypothetical protein